MTSSSSDPIDWQQHNTSKQDRKKSEIDSKIRKIV